MIKLLWMFLWCPTCILTMVKWIYARLSEASSWAGLAVVAIAVGANIPEISGYCHAFAGIAGAIAFAIKNRDHLVDEITNDKPADSEKK